MKPFPELVRVSPHIEIFLFQREGICLNEGDQLSVLFGTCKDTLDDDLPKASCLDIRSAWIDYWLEAERSNI